MGTRLSNGIVTKASRDQVINIAKSVIRYCMHVNDVAKFRALVHYCGEAKPLVGRKTAELFYEFGLLKAKPRTVRHDDDTVTVVFKSFVCEVVKAMGHNNAFTPQIPIVEEEK